MKAEAIETAQLIDIAREKRGGWTRFYATPRGRKIHSRHNCVALANTHGAALMPELSGMPAWIFTWPGGSHLCHYCGHAEARNRA
jgi:hypothetical protein